MECELSKEFISRSRRAAAGAPCNFAHREDTWVRAEQWILMHWDQLVSASRPRHGRQCGILLELLGLWTGFGTPPRSAGDGSMARVPKARGDRLWRWSETGDRDLPRLLRLGCDAVA